MKLLNKFKKVLIVEDDPALLKALVRKVESKGFAVITESSGTPVPLTVVREKPAGILLDLMLPGQDGLKLLAQLRSTEIDYKKPVVILTNLHGRAGLRDEAERLQAVYLDKASTSIGAAVDALVKQL